MTLPEIPADLVASVKRLFRSDKRKAIAMELLCFPYWPSKDEKQVIANKYELSITSIDKILYKLRDNNYFSKKQGSVPLYSVINTDAPKLNDAQDVELNTCAHAPILEIKIPSLALEIKIHSCMQNVGEGY